MSLKSGEFLEKSDLNFFLRELLSHMNSQKCDNPLSYCENYFKRVQSCHHVIAARKNLHRANFSYVQIIGEDYSFATGCRYNRHALVFCLRETSSNFDKMHEFSTVEFQQIIELVCPDFPRQIVMEAAHAIPTRNTDGGNFTYSHEHLKVALFFHIIYEDWLKEIEKVFRRDTFNAHLDIAVLRNHISDFHRKLPASVEQPSKVLTESVLNSHSFLFGEITYDDFRRELFSNAMTGLAVSKTPKNAVSLLSFFNSPSIDGGKGKAPLSGES